MEAAYRALEELVGPGDAVLLALSGGADSVALFHLLLEHRERVPFALEALHVEHGIRAEASLADAAFAEALCAEEGIPFTLRRVDAPAEAARSKGGLEDAARRLRHAALRDSRGNAKIALAHHADDQAETLLLHLVRGSGPRGMRGMKADDPPYIRPLLGVRAADLRAWLRARGIPWREDASNADIRYARNRLRHQVLPELEEINPGAVQALCRFASLMEQREDFMGEQVQDYLAENRQSMPYGERLLRREAHPALLSEVLRAFLAERLNIEQRHIALLLQGKDVEPPRGLRILADARGWYAPDGREKPRGAWPFVLPGEILCPTGVLRAELVSAPASFKEEGVHYLCPGALESAALRYRRPGDRFHRFGGGDKKLKEAFIEKGIERPLRDFLPLLAREGHVLWAAGLGIAEEARVTNGEKAVRLEYTQYT